MVIDDKMFIYNKTSRCNQHQHEFYIQHSCTFIRWDVNKKGIHKSYRDKDNENSKFTVDEFRSAIAKAFSLGGLIPHIEDDWPLSLTKVTSSGS